jgi:hypothetical protein
VVATGRCTVHVGRNKMPTCCITVVVYFLFKALRICFVRMSVCMDTSAVLAAILSVGVMKSCMLQLEGRGFDSRFPIPDEVIGFFQFT